MQVQARFFAAYRDLLGSTEITVRLPSGATVGDLVSHLRERGRPYDGLPPEPAVAVNRTYSGLEAHLSDGDEVAFIPPVAGG